MKTKELKREISEKSTQELTDSLREMKAQLFTLRFQLATGQLENTMQLRECRRKIARVMTILTDRERKAQA